MGYPNAADQNPSQYVIMNDPYFTDSTMTATTQAQPYIKTPTPSTSNEGDLYPFLNQRHASNTALTDMDLYEFRTGGLVDNAEWGWKYDSDAGTKYRGLDDIMWIKDQGLPFETTFASGYASHGVAIGVSKRFNRILFIREPDSSTASAELRINYRDIDAANPFSYTSFDLTLTRPRATGNESITACIELPDGSMRLFVKTTNAGDNTCDFDLYTSQDGGLTWSFVNVDLFKTYGGAGGNDATAFMWGTADISGDWIRLSVIEQVPASGPAFAQLCGTLRTLVSGDRGATWREITRITSVALEAGNKYDLYIKPNDRVGSASDLRGFNYIMDMVGTGRSDGSFYMAVHVNTHDSDPRITGNNMYYRFTASADGDWVVLDSNGWYVNRYPDAASGLWSAGYGTLTIPTPNASDEPTKYLLRIALFTDGIFIYEVLIAQNGNLTANTNTVWNMVKIPVEYYNDLTKLSNISLKMAGASGGCIEYSSTSRFEPANLRIKQAGEKAIILTGLDDPLTTSPVGQLEDLTLSMAIRGWTQKSIRSSEPDSLTPLNSPTTGGTYTSTQLFDLCWQSAMGLPYSHASLGPIAGAGWIDNASGGASVDWSPARIYINSNPGAGHRFFSENPAWSFALLDDGIIVVRVMVVAITHGLWPTPSAYEPFIGARIKVSGASSKQAEISIALDAAGNLEVKDRNGGTSAIITMSGISYTTAGKDAGGGYADIRVAFKKNASNYNLQVSYSNSAGGEYAWVESSKVSLTTVTATTSGIDWGHIATRSGTDDRESAWKSIYTMNKSYNHVDFSNPFNMRGATVAPYEQYLKFGVYCKWGGGGGFLGDTWDANVGYQYPKEAVKVNSPSVTWRSLNDTDNQHVTFDADPTDGIKRFRIGGVAVFGTNCRYMQVEFGTITPAVSTTPPALTHNLLIDCAIQVNLEIVTFTPNSVTVKDKTSSDKDIFRDGQLTGYIIHIEGETQSDPTLSFRISHNYGRVIHLKNLTSSLGGRTAIGRNCQVIAPFGVLALNPYEYRGPTGTGGAAATANSRFMRLWFYKEDYQSGGVWYRNPVPEGETGFELGSVVCGPAVGFAIPMDWESTEGNTPNIQEKVLANGMKIRYKLGPARRRVTGRVTGDALEYFPDNSATVNGITQFRRMFRDMISTFAEYSVDPMCLVLNWKGIKWSNYWTGGAGPANMNVNIPDQILYCTFVGDVNLDEQGWQGTDTTSPSRLGDMAVTFEEEV